MLDGAAHRRKLVEGALVAHEAVLSGVGMEDAAHTRETYRHKLALRELNVRYSCEFFLFCFCFVVSFFVCFVL